MDLIQQIREKARQNKKRIVLPETGDIRVIQAAEFLVQEQLCEVILLRNEHSVATSIDLLDTQSNVKRNIYAGLLYQRRKHKGLTQVQALALLNNPLYYGATMVAADEADGCVAGSVSTTGEVLKSAIQAIGLKRSSNVVSSIFLMSFQDGRNYSYGDCAVVPYPNARQLATIALDSANTHKKITGAEPKVAMLSFSSKGSAEHERVSLVREALDLAKEQAPKLDIDGELQFDAAIVEEIAKKKAPLSDVAGNANVFIFPNLDAGNIAYKITERLGGAQATGPIIQGLNKPMMDLSRGCTWEDIVNTACVCALMCDHEPIIKGRT